MSAPARLGEGSSGPPDAPNACIRTSEGDSDETVAADCLPTKPRPEQEEYKTRPDLTPRPA